MKVTATLYQSSAETDAMDSDYRGKVLFAILDHAFRTHSEIEIDIQDTPITTHFLHASIGALVLKHGTNAVRSIITFTGFDNDDCQLIDQVIENAEQQREKQAEESKA